MAKRKGKTANRAAYDKEVKRIKQFIRRAQKRGFEFRENILPSKPPKRVTKSAINRLKKLTPDTLYKQAQYIDVYTGEILSGIKGRELERSRAAQKAAETRRERKSREAGFFARIVIDRYRNYVSEFNIGCQRSINSWLNWVISRYGESAVANMLEMAAQNNEISLYSVAYDEDKLRGYMARMLDFMEEAGPLDRAAMEEALEEDAAFVDYR